MVRLRAHNPVLLTCISAAYELSVESTYCNIITRTYLLYTIIAKKSIVYFLNTDQTHESIPPFYLSGVVTVL
jgi:hypothetical protein